MTTPLKVAVTAWQLAGAHDYARQAAIAESIGLHSFWLPESHFSGARSIPSPLMLLAAAAATTTKIRLGSTSYLLPIRHPLHAAEEVAVLDCLSAGRVILGVGRGVQESMFQAFDVKTRDKRKRFAANLEIMIRAWKGEPVVDGDDNAILAPLPLQKPHPPIWVAAFGPLAIKQAASLGLPYLASPVETLDQLESNYSHHRKLVREFGLDAVDIVPVMRTILVSNNKREVEFVKTALAEPATPAMRDQNASIDDWTIVGDAHYVADKLSEYREKLGMTHLIARGRIPGVDDAAWISNLERLAEIALG